MNADTIKSIVAEATSETIKQQCEQIIELHNKMKNCYFFASPKSSSARRAYENYNSMKTEFVISGKIITIAQTTHCTSTNVYYNLKIYVDGEQINKDIRFIKKLLRSVE